MRAKVVVVGAGIMGCAAARALANDGHEVTVFEQFRVGHDRGSSHGRSRIFRLAYPELEYVQLAREALHGWRALEKETGTKVLELNGLLELVADPARSSRDVLVAAGVSCRHQIADFTSARALHPAELLGALLQETA